MNNAKNILVVDDEQDALTLFLDIISAGGYSVEGARDGQEALNKLSAKKYDLVLLDIIMPNKDGIATLEEIHLHPETYGKPIINMLTNISSDAAVEKAIALGATGYILKADTTPEDLLKTVNKLLN
jgi:CheY-like chemotaxis protein